MIMNCGTRPIHLNMRNVISLPIIESKYLFCHHKQHVSIVCKSPFYLPVQAGRLHPACRPLLRTKVQVNSCRSIIPRTSRGRGVVVSRRTFEGFGSEILFMGIIGPDSLTQTQFSYSTAVPLVTPYSIYSHTSLRLFSRKCWTTPPP